MSDQVVDPTAPVSSASSIVDDDELLLRRLGYKQTLVRSYKLLESWAASFAAVYTLGGLRATFSIGIYGGGPQAYWITYLISSVFVLVTAAVLAEICSSLPAAGSIYFWAAEAAGPRFGRLFAFVVAWWTTTAWTTFVASNSQGATYYMLSQINVWGGSFTTDPSDIKFRALAWICSQLFLAIAMATCFLGARVYKYIFRLSVFMILLDFLLNIIWVPIGVSKTYGFRSAEFAFLETINWTGAPPAWNWMLSFFATGGIMIGFDASGHIAEETKNASLVAARGIWWSAVSCVAIGFPYVILFLFCMPDLDTFSSLTAPQPFVMLYSLALGKAGSVVMIVLIIFTTVLNTSVSIVAASRLVYAIARDGVLPFSGWISKVAPNGQPKNALWVIWGVSAIVLCTILPSPTAFSSLISASGVPTVASWGLIAFGRFFLTPHQLMKSRWSLGFLSRPFHLIAFLWNTFLSGVMFSPLFFPVDGAGLNYAPVIMGAVTLFALACWWFIPEEKWLEKRKIRAVIASNQENFDDIVGHQSEKNGVRERIVVRGAEEEA
ncbi:hypothetical protein G7K_4582-t1 [Saitoella complicata NRRL Y-17804]|uniref:Amino acid permease/ SLC12A domain-containing protein n=1 Tax=Saitoella complicata (strain BCRC 22490 / CBS 7301 / JCM 7358 / NBRC 10748 / NRRL Y-17804) TaxID=698492 RepID=A0A0E9NKY7_SAICN|nr:hypothetical protein G7K_4582-t1 [Saitoella complicata NRRL Y-17804]